MKPVPCNLLKNKLKISIMEVYYDRKCGATT